MQNRHELSCFLTSNNGVEKADELGQITSVRTSRRTIAPALSFARAHSDTVEPPLALCSVAGECGGSGPTAVAGPWAR
jgi:hypothetical protein